MNQLHLTGNVLNANSTQSTNLIESEQNEHRKLARTALQIITGVKEPEASNLASLFRQIEFLDIADVKAIMRLGCDTYSDSYNKYPTPYFWKGVKREVLRKKTAMAPEKIIPRKKQSDQEREEVSKIARELALKFETESNKNKTVNLLEKKFERYRGYVERDLVRVESRCALFQQWIPRDQAMQIGVDVHCPKKWIESRSMGISKI